MNKPLTVACLGAGYFSQFHTEAWHRNPRTVLIGCADQSVEKATATAAKQAFSCLEDMLRACQPDILDIVTPPETHFSSIDYAVGQQVNAIICQKPFCRSLKEAHRAVALAAAADIPLIVHENFRFQPWYRCMKQAITDNQLGQVLQFTFRLRTGDGQGDDAYLDRQPYFRDMPRLLIHETGVHWIDTFRYLLGPAESVYADLRTLNPCVKGEDAGFIIFGYADGKRALFDGNRLLDHKTANARITLGEALLEGTNGQISLDGNGEVTFRKFGETRTRVLLEAKQWQGFAGDCVYALQDHVVNALLEGSALENQAAEYLPVVELVDRVYASAEASVRLNINDI